MSSIVNRTASPNIVQFSGRGIFLKRKFRLNHLCYIFEMTSSKSKFVLRKFFSPENGISYNVISRKTSFISGIFLFQDSHISERNEHWCWTTIGWDNNRKQSHSNVDHFPRKHIFHFNIFCSPISLLDLLRTFTMTPWCSCLSLRNLSRYTTSDWRRWREDWTNEQSKREKERISRAQSNFGKANKYNGIPMKIQSKV